MNESAKRTIVHDYWMKRPLAELEARRVEFRAERDRYPEATEERREVEWYLALLEEVLTARRT